MNRNLFITFEGGEGAGKTSVLKAIGERLKEEQVNALLTREPGGIDIAEKIRAVILNPAHTKMHERTEALLYAAARAQHFYEKIIPALQEGKHVLCDRFIDSSLAYQGYAREIGVDDVLAINQFAIGQRLPDMTIFFDLAPEKGLARIQATRADEINRLDIEGIAFHQKVYEGYQVAMNRYPDRFKVVNADQPLEQVIEDVWEILNPILG
ncbi:dTMP kinase [Lysinibacillus sp. 2017]|uniref:dTMP kinase n=1 Tax=unclassified Lysinibacillus TaxID=2636778 RepID=UPI000D5267C8|nr:MULTISPECIES: dTMP kinase [unclassified Lysinibacillus]AWE05929.1 dTMP kinase [Lysinibacillus sp. 2017]TGN33424.1 dTMP kinase [Lysinibacillus sp. S2017]